MGPIALFDKSFLQSLNVDESVWFDHFFVTVVSPFFYVETLADLARTFKAPRIPDQQVRAIAENELQPHERRILDFEDYDVVVVRGADGYCAFNNACPHLHLPLYERRSPAQTEGLQIPHTESTITSDLGLVCRWHQSCFDLLTGEIRRWAQLQQDGTAPGYEYAGDISKNRARLAIYPCRQQDGFVWIGLD